MNGVINTSDGELESSAESCERWGWRCGGLVVIGVVAEFVIAALNPPYGSFWERWGVAVADALVAFGVVGEIMFSRMGHSRQSELTQRANRELADAKERLGDLELEAGFAGERTAQALERAAKAELELAKLQKLTAARSVDETAFCKKLVGKPKAPVAIEYLPDTSDGFWFAHQLFNALHKSGWEVGWPAPVPEIPSEHSIFGWTKAMYAGGQPTGMTIVTPEGEVFLEGNTPQNALWNAIAASTDWGISGAASQFRPVPKGTLRLVIAAKPDPILGTLWAQSGEGSH